MSLVRDFIDRLRRKRPAAPPPVIETEFGPVTEWARAQAAINMRIDANLRARVLAIVIRECDGDQARGEREFRRRYPELFEGLR